MTTPDTPLSQNEKRSLLHRFWSKVPPSDECWEWQGGKLPGGYGTIGLGSVEEGKGYAHRVAYELFVGPIPEGMEVCHTCDNPPCVNPAHLFVDTPSGNRRDMIEKGRERPWNRGIRTCKRGHEFTEENTRIANGRRVCRACSRDRERKRKRERGGNT